MMSTAFHSQTDGQSEITIQILEDMIQACVLDLKGRWKDYLPFVEFAYNNSYHSSIQMASYAALYGRPCRSPVCWTEVGKRPLRVRAWLETLLRRWTSFRSIFLRLINGRRVTPTDEGDL